jgi:hypothetical protein
MKIEFDIFNFSDSKDGTHMILPISTDQSWPLFKEILALCFLDLFKI